MWKVPLFNCLLVSWSRGNRLWPGAWFGPVRSRIGLAPTCIADVAMGTQRRRRDIIREIGRVPLGGCVGYVPIGPLPIHVSDWKIHRWSIPSDLIWVGQDNVIDSEPMQLGGFCLKNGGFDANPKLSKNEHAKLWMTYFDEKIAVSEHSNNDILGIFKYKPKTVHDNLL